jgi:hypothetical protein
MVGQEQTAAKSAPLPKGTGADIAYGTAKVGISAIPLVGGSASEAFSLILAPPLSKRRDIWFQNLRDDLDVLKDRIEGFSFEELAENESFVSATMAAAQASLKTHDCDKLQALRNAVVNVAAGLAPDEAKQSFFLQLVDQLTPLHLRLLKFQHDVPGRMQEFLAAHPEVRRRAGKPMVFEMVTHHFPGFRGEGQLIHSVFQDLHARGLSAVEGALVALPNIQGRWTNHLGDDFLKFISSPVNWS